MPLRVLVALRAEPDRVAAPLRATGARVEVCPPGQVARRGRAWAPDACLVEPADKGLPALLRELAGLAFPPAVVLLHPPESSEPATEALRAGAAAVLPASVSPDLLRATIERCVHDRVLALELRERRQRLLRRDAGILAGTSQAVRRLDEALSRVASTPRTTVLVRGPIGAGLRSVARLVHDRSSRAGGPLLEVEGGAIAGAREAADLLGSGEGEVPDWGRAGRLVGGTLLLHGVERLTAAAQERLGAFLGARGGEESAPDVRVVATTTPELEEHLERGRFREDLHYRLNVLTLRVPGLEDRREDVEALARELLEGVATDLGRPELRLDPAAAAALARRAWPGQLVELEACLRLAAARSGQRTLRTDDLQGLGPPVEAEPEATPSVRPADLLGAPEAALPVQGRRLKDAEEALIRRVLAEVGGNKVRAAELLGIHRTTLYNKLKSYGLA